MNKRLTTIILAFSMVFIATAAYAEIRIGAIFDRTGSLNIYGIQQQNALELAIENINANGGVLGEKIKLISYDAQSELSKYTQYANTAILRDDISAMFAGLTSSSREAIRPIFRRAKVPYFYTSLYEGGACDKQTFVTGSSASQQLEPLIKWAIEKYGPKIYIMAPNYNFGTISAYWIHEYAARYGGEVVGEDFLALTVSDYAPTMQKIQRSAPNFVVALPVGANQTGFLEQFAAAGLKDKIGVVSSNYGSGNQQVVLSSQAGEGLIASQEYFMGVDNPANKEFVAMWTAKYGDEIPIVSVAVNVWNAAHIWATAVEKANSANPDAVIAALESGISFVAPNGKVTMEPGSHHLRQNIYIAEGDDNHGFKIVKTIENAPPSYENKMCDLIAHPKLVEHFVPEKN